MAVIAPPDQPTAYEAEALARYVDAIARLSRARKAMRRARSVSRRRAARHALEEAEALCRRARLEVRAQAGFRVRG